MNTIKPDAITDLKQKPTFQLYVQIIRQIYKRIMDDITANDQQVLNNAFESFQKEFKNISKMMSSPFSEEGLPQTVNYLFWNHC